MKKKLVGANSSETVEFNWGKGSFIRPVLREDILPTQNQGVISLITLALPYLIMSLSLALFSLFEELDPSFNAWLKSFAIVLGLGGFALLFLHGHIDKFIFLAKLRKRQDLLFKPDVSDIYLLIENTESRHQLKLFADDFGFARIETAYVFIELGSHQARLNRDYLHVSLERVSARGTNSLFWSVILSYPNPDPEWNVACVAPFQNFNPLLANDLKSQAKWLYNKIAR